MSAINTEATAIAGIIEAVEGAGVVFDAQPLPVNGWSEFVERFTTTVDDAVQVRAWTVEYDGETRVPVSVAMGQTKYRREVRWVVRGHLTWSDGTGSALTFRDLVWAVAAALDTARSKGDVYYESDPVDIVIPAAGGGVLLGDVLCHVAELTFTGYAHETVATV